MARPGRPALPKPDLHPTVDAFLEMLTAERGAADNTRQAYWRDLADITKYLRKKRNTDLDKATTADLEDYLSTLASKQHTKGAKTKPIAVRTVARRLSALRQFYRYMVSENMRDDDPTTPIDSPKQTRTLPKTLSEEEVTRLITTAGVVGKKPESARLVCLLEMLYSSGLRVSELVGLPVSAIAENQEFLTIKGKNGRDRVVPLSEPAQDAMGKYLKFRKHFIGTVDIPNQQQWLFPSRTSGSGHLTRQRFAQLLKDLAIAADVDEDRVSPHVLRHAFATHLLSRGADLRSVQKMLGHADIATTQIYTQILDEKKKDAVESKHPMGKGQKTGTNG